MIYAILFFTHSLVMIAGLVLAAAIGSERKKLDDIEIYRLKKRVYELEGGEVIS